jgi:hypothetical protein
MFMKKCEDRRSKSFLAFVSLLSIVFVVLVAPGCTFRHGQVNHHGASVIRAVHCAKNIDLDGRLDEAVWELAPAYDLHSASDESVGRTFESGRIKACWNANYLYVAIEFDDSDIIAEAIEDQVHHYRFGDVAELFLKPADADCYWELYVTPRGNRSAFFYPSHGRLGLPSTMDDQFRLNVAASVDGTIGDWSDRDEGWSAEFAVSVADLVHRSGAEWGPGAPWTILVGRYNYGRYNEQCELSSVPGLPAADFHDRARFARLLLESPGTTSDK